MTALVLVLAVVAGVRWLFLSPVRLAAAGVVLLLTHPVPTFVFTSVAVLAVTLAAGGVAFRSLRDGGWYLVTVQRAGFAVSRAGGVAS